MKSEVLREGTPALVDEKELVALVVIGFIVGRIRVNTGIPQAARPQEPCKLSCAG